MKAVRILDCTLRDGGRIIDCQFDGDVIKGIDKQLCKAGTDIIEVGFLRDIKQYKGNCTFFSKPQDADSYIGNFKRQDETKYVLFVDYGLYCVDQLAPAFETKISGIRYGFTKKNFFSNRNDIIREMNHIKNLGYELYLQDVNTNGYTAKELLELIEMANEIHPVSFGIVDTYGTMYLDDLEYIWSLVNGNLLHDIAVDFHSHDNLEMSFALSQRLISLAQNKRNIILDSTLHGMAKCAGNLKTELIMDFMSRKLNYDYNLDSILDAIDQYIYKYQETCHWGYSVPAVMAGIFRSHPNNIIYLTEKYRLNNRDIKYILSQIDEEKRQRYDYDNISNIYRKYCATKVDDEEAINDLRAKFKNADILLLAPGSSVQIYEEKIKEYISTINPTVINVNFVTEKLPKDYIFFANTIHWEKAMDKVNHEKCILTSNIHVYSDAVYMVDYSRLVVEDSFLGDNSTIMCLYLLKELQVKSITLAGFDGLQEGKDNYIKNNSPRISDNLRYVDINKEVERLYRQFVQKSNGRIKIEFLTPSIYA